jgi:predicted Zn-dependent protease
MTEYNPKLIVDISEYTDPFNQLENGIQWLLSKSKEEGYEAEIVANFAASSTARYARNQMIQYTDLDQISFSLKLVEDKKFASVSTTLLGDKGYSGLFNEVKANLKNSREIPFYQGLPEPKTGLIKNLEARPWSIEDKAEVISKAVNASESYHQDVIVAGTAMNRLNYTRIVNTNNIDVETSSSLNYFKINSIVGEPESRGYGQEGEYWRTSEPDYVELAKRSTQTAIDTTKLITLEAKEYEVILEPQALSDIILFVQMSLDPTSFHESYSFASDKIGEQIFDSKLTIQDLPLDPEKSAIVRSYDSEGIPTENRKVFNNGVLEFIPYDSFAAAKFLDNKNLATGNMTSFYGSNTALPVSFYVNAGTKTTEQLIGNMEDGLLVKNFWYNRFTKRQDGGLTGLTRNGLYHIKNGEIHGAVRNLRYTESFVKAFGHDNIIDLSSDNKMFQLNSCPSIHLKSYNFSSIAHSFD